MQTHGPKRIYTPQSLEFWFGKLENDWAPNFDEGHLELGRNIYRDGEIREIELGTKDAIIHRKVEKKDEYAVIEWNTDGKLVVRSSSSDQVLANAIAIAGLHEIEELVADEISPLPDDSPDPSAHEPSGAKNGLNGGRGTVVDSAAARKLVLVFKTKSEGVVFNAVWINPDKSKTPALGHAASGNGHPVPLPNQAERGKLIALAAYARKAHFVYKQETHTYVLSTLKEIPDFLKNVLPAWKRMFAVELDDKSANLLKGVRVVEVEAYAEKKNGNGLNLRWIFKAGESLLSEEEVNLLTKRGAAGPIILPSIGLVSLPAEKWESLTNWSRNVEETHAGGVLPPYLIFSLFNDSRIKVSLSPEVEAWRQNVLTIPIPPPPLPEYLRPYQRRGVEWLHHLCETGCHGLLADEMGLGKTLQVITLLAARSVSGDRNLIVCPASVVPVWREEIARFCPQLKVEILKTGYDFTNHSGPAVWLASYTQLRKHKPLLEGTEFGYAVLDEGQFIKNPDAKVTHACFSIKSKHRIVLTGTPLENRQLDLWSIFRFLLPGLLGSRHAFESSLNTDRVGTIERLRKQLAPFILRRTKGEVAKELPPKVEMDLLCPLTELQRTEYARICSEGLERLGEDIGAAMREKSFGFLALLTRLRQVCCDPDLLPWLKAPLSESGKINLLIEKLAEIVGSGHKVVIFSQFVMLLDRVRTALETNFPELPRYELTGMTVDRQKPVHDFQCAKGSAAMLVSLKAAGTGITLHAADYVFLLDPWWNPAVEAQAIDRVHRIGQTNTVFVYRMVTAGTIEERIQALKASKRELFDQIMGTASADFDLSQHFHSLQSLIQLSLPEVAEIESH